MRVTMRLPAPLQSLVGAPAVVSPELPEGATVADAFDALRAELPVAESKLRDERGQIREHVNVFVDGADVKRGAGTATPLTDGATLIVLSAVSGG